jgi:hypothetical protein
MRKVRLWIGSIAGLLMALSAFVLPAQASTITTSDMFMGTSTTGTFVSMSGNLVAPTSSSGAGTLSPLGSYTVTTSGTVTAFGSCSDNCFTVTGVVTDTFAGGTLFGTFTDIGSNSGTVSNGTLSLVITGGTGAYLGYTGTETETAVVTIATGAFTGTGAGSLTTTPLPSTWLMLLSGFLGLGFFAYRGINKSVAAVAAA